MIASSTDTLATALTVATGRRQLLRGIGAFAVAAATGAALASTADASRNGGNGRGRGRNGQGRDERGERNDEDRRDDRNDRNGQDRERQRDRDRDRDRDRSRTPGTPATPPAPPAPALPTIEATLDPAAGGVIRVTGIDFRPSEAVFLQVRGDWSVERGWEIDFTDAIMANSDGGFLYEVSGFYPFTIQVEASNLEGPVAADTAEFDGSPIPLV